MQLNIVIDGREVNYTLGSEAGEGLSGLIKFLSGKQIDKVTISGESKSYTFLRQIALLVNLLAKANHITIDLKSKSYLSKGDLLVPIYEQ